ncbi:DODA-type extradiol aromatic ring-opening family dioxygenase [Cohnella silvisoli]|uniref:Class III extradiol ring-cleavage dioxygenase n=1 Tax=Cohnella silvisoli TaxID=2873699 RepID=A0ABV1KW12_9BACL|nr:class III extradiol ring-cleavage dioxygenase [Cohnella silvisoli]MCD9023638.1 dioxygenase [Cohnella silvisoli]
MLPSLFINHGSPMMIKQQSDYTHFLKDIGKRFTPKAIVIFSAHWEEKVTTVSFADGPLETIYDFYGFPDDLYEIAYPAPGSPQVAEKLEKLFQTHGIPSQRDNKRGLDHGAWVFLRHMYPEADIPVVTVSVNPFLSAAEQYKIGEAFRTLGEENILVIGSGTTVHNFNYIKFGQQHPEPWAVEFDDWLIEKIQAKDLQSLVNYEQLAPYASRAVPRAEHFVPLFLAMGSSSGEQTPSVLYRGYEFGTFSNTCFEF